MKSDTTAPRAGRETADDIEEAEICLASAEALLAALRMLCAADEDGRTIDDALDRVTTELLDALEVVDRIRVRRSL